ncbi:hypothetical protein ACFE04_011465 [Oxalis oulophora]
MRSMLRRSCFTSIASMKETEQMPILDVDPEPECFIVDNSDVYEHVDQPEPAPESRVDLCLTLPAKKRLSGGPALCFLLDSLGLFLGLSALTSWNPVVTESSTCLSKGRDFWVAHHSRLSKGRARSNDYITGACYEVRSCCPVKDRPEEGAITCSACDFYGNPVSSSKGFPEIQDLSILRNPNSLVTFFLNILSLYEILYLFQILQNLSQLSITPAFRISVLASSTRD